jgi:membrane-associated phospholipid phosphatase
MTDQSPSPTESQRLPVPVRPGTWHPSALVVGCSACVLLLASWLLEPTRSLWLALDEKVFWALNSSLSCCRAWQVFWALANNRLVDIVAALAMVGLYLHFLLGEGRGAKDRLLAIGAMLSGLVLIAVQMGKAFPYRRPSATLIHSSAIRLTELVSWLPTKDASTDTFPGDHAAVLFICAGVITVYLPRAYAAAAWTIAVVFLVPRLVSGAHWLTDDVVGAASFAGLVLTCTFATPLHRVLTDNLERVIARLLARRRGSV